jgi:hypothetical protein
MHSDFSQKCTAGIGKVRPCSTVIVQQHCLRFLWKRRQLYTWKPSQPHGVLEGCSQAVQHWTMEPWKSRRSNALCKSSKSLTCLIKHPSMQTVQEPAAGHSLCSGSKPCSRSYLCSVSNSCRGSSLCSGPGLAASLTFAAGGSLAAGAIFAAGPAFRYS